MPRVYWDNTFYDFIAKEREGFAHGDVEHFRALSGRVIRSYFSPVNGDEILAQWASDRAVALQEARNRPPGRVLRPRAPRGREGRA